MLILEALHFRARFKLQHVLTNVAESQSKTESKLLFSTEVSLDEKKANKQANRTISTGQLNALLHVHLPPINVVVSNGPYKG
jgi:hypothetical protein